MVDSKNINRSVSVKNENWYSLKKSNLKLLILQLIDKLQFYKQ